MFFSSLAALALSAASTLVAATPVPAPSGQSWPESWPHARDLIGDEAVAFAHANPDVIKKRSVQDAPHFVIYDDAWTNEGQPPAPSNITGFNVFIISFWWDSGPQDMAQAWEELTDAQRTTVKSEYTAAGVKLMVAAFGSNNFPTSSDAATVAGDLAAWVKKYQLDGADADYEDFTAMNNGESEQWLVDFTKALRNGLPASDYIITHAPVAPWFTDSGRYNITGSAVGGYLWVDQQVGDLIDWYNVQFYNQDDYTTCDTLLTKSGNPDWPHSALFEIVANGVDQNKLVLGKPATTSDANNGYVAPSLLATCVSQAKAQGWNAGLMVWQYPHEATNWVSVVWGSDSGSGGGGSTTTTSSSSSSVSTTSTSTSGGGSTTSTPSTTSTSSGGGSTGTSGSCSGAKAWDSSVAYVADDQVTYQGSLYKASYWNENEVPSGVSGAWSLVAACNGSRIKRVRRYPAAHAPTAAPLARRHL